MFYVHDSSQRKNADNLKFSLGEIVVAVFCTSLVGAGEDQKVKLNKVRFDFYKDSGLHEVLVLITYPYPFSPYHTNL